MPWSNGHAFSANISLPPPGMFHYTEIVNCKLVKHFSVSGNNYQGQVPIFLGSKLMTFDIVPQRLWRNRATMLHLIALPHSPYLFNLTSIAPFLFGSFCYIFWGFFSLFFQFFTFFVPQAILKDINDEEVMIAFENK